MDATFYLSCFAMGTFGLIISTAMIMRSLSKKARLSNVIYNSLGYFKDDWFIFVITYGVIGSMLIAMAYVPGTILKNDWALLITLGLFSLVGYNANDIASRFYSVANQKLNSAIDYKTTIADQTTGTTENPTPAK